MPGDVDRYATEVASAESLAICPAGVSIIGRHPTRMISNLRESSVFRCEIPDVIRWLGGFESYLGHHFLNKSRQKTG